MPMYWQGFYGPPNGLPQLHQQSLLRPPPGLTMPPSMQPPMQFSGFNASLPIGPPSLPGSNLPEYSSPLVPISTSSLNLTTSSLPPSTLPSTLPPVPPGMLSSEKLPSMIPNKAPISAIPTAALSVSLQPLSPLTTPILDVNAIGPPISNKPSAVPGPPLPYQDHVAAYIHCCRDIQFNPSRDSHPFTCNPRSTAEVWTCCSCFVPVFTNGSQRRGGGSSITNSIIRADSTSCRRSSAPNTANTANSRVPKPNGAHFQTHYNHRGRGSGRGRGTGISRPLTKFTEEFDFMAMNEKFNKDEVWGHLGKSSKSQSKDKEGDGQGSDDDDDSQYEDDAELLKFEIKPVYNKDDFFDSLSCTALDNDPNNGRTRFSEQLKIDTETFGEFSRYRGGRGGRGPVRGGRFRGSYYGRGYGYVNRGRGRGFSNRGS
ncbi:unnamed protein product [Ilex paraguariensis]|uniref:Protein decapping 5 n=1 Tax=Ilex paraguariensis TaxID=185542 RepID=A0ABC8TPU2_9AQUA